MPTPTCHTSLSPPHVLFGLFGQQHPRQLSPFHTHSLSFFLSFFLLFGQQLSFLHICDSSSQEAWLNQHLHVYHGRNPKNKFGLLVNMLNIWSLTPKTKACCRVPVEAKDILRPISGEFLNTFGPLFGLKILIKSFIIIVFIF